MNREFLCECILYYSHERTSGEQCWDIGQLLQYVLENSWVASCGLFSKFWASLGYRSNHGTCCIEVANFVNYP